MEQAVTKQIDELVDALQSSRHVVVLTGAGASTEAGLPDWRGPAGMWKQWSPTQMASLSAMQQNPVEFYQFYRYRLSKLRGAVPGPTQRALAALEAAGKIHCIITQNIDRLHQAAGSRNVIEVHGSLDTAVCVKCGREYSPEVLDVDVETADDVPRCDTCGGYLKPGIVLFEEPLPQDAIAAAFAESERADLFMVVGSSLEVGPVNMLPARAAHAGARLAIVNLSETHLDWMANWLIREKAGVVLTEVVKRLGIECQSDGLTKQEDVSGSA